MKKTLSIILATLVLSINTPSVVAEQKSDNSYLIDFVVLNENKTIDDRKAYERLINPIIKKHGAVKEQSYLLNNFIGGQLEGASILNIYKMENADTLVAIGNDPDYKKIDELRNTVHDMSKLTLYIGEALTNVGQLNDKLLLVDIVVMNEGYGHPERFVYEEKVRKIASKFGVTLYNSFDIDKKLAGIGPEQALKLNIWALPSPDAMKKLGEDPEYQKLIEYRNKFHNMNAITLYMGSPAS